MTLDASTLSKLRELCDEYKEHSMPSAVAFKLALVTPELLDEVDRLREDVRQRCNQLQDRGYELERLQTENAELSKQLANQLTSQPC